MSKKWNGFSVTKRYFGLRKYFIVEPEKRKENNCWIWRTEFFGAFPYADIDMLKKGYVLVYVDMHDMYGAPKAIALMEKFYNFVTAKYNLNKKTILFGFSRGGLYSINFAAANPEKIESLYLDAPVVDINSWPFGLGKGKGSEEDSIKCQKLYGVQKGDPKIREEAERKIKILSENKIPIILVSGDSDSVVPYEENGAIIEENYDKDFIKVIIKPGCDHHPHSIDPPDEITEFLISKQ